jgi:hypothetical protein
MLSHKKAIEDGARPVESAKPIFQPGSRLATLQQAAENARKAQSANYANRYSGAEKCLLLLQIPQALD